MKKTKRMLALILSLALLLTSCGGGGARATTMHLTKTEGRVGVSDDKGKDVEPRDDLGLYSGYGVDTRSESYAWIDLDDVKLTKLDQDSKIEIQKDGKALEITVKEGSLFFNVTEPLEDDETMTIRASSMLVGIRGTCGWVALSEDKSTLTVGLLEGKVECSNGENTAAVSAGELGTIPASGEITVEEFTASDIPEFVVEEIEDDDDLAEAILDDSGIDLTGGGSTSSGELDDYAEILDEIRASGAEVLYAEVFDFEADGNPELLAIVDEIDNTRDVSTNVHIYRKGQNGISWLTRYGAWPGNAGGKISLVESGGRLFVRTSDFETFTDLRGDYISERAHYNGSVAEKDGEPGDWNTVEYLSWGQYGAEITYVRSPHDERGFITRNADGSDDLITAEEYAATQAKYNEVKVLVYFPDDKSYIVLPDPSEIEELSRPDGST